jgi:ATP-dependent exoDNAse (exonuclease V) beta subunit
MAHELTDEQERAAARRSGSLLLAAGAGSGKTAVLVERFVRAVREDAISPGRILAITFTERAAGELRERVRARLLAAPQTGELGARKQAHDAEAAFVTTFHGFCARLLRAHPLQAGIEPGARILEEGFASRLRMLAFGDALAAFLAGERQQAVDLVAAYGPDRLRAIVLGAHAQLRSQGQRQPALPLPHALGRIAGDATGDDAIVACGLLDELLRGFDEAYALRKQARAALDFDDLELLARDLLVERAELRRAWAERFELLMVDEFQDSNQRQLQILAALDRDNLFTVGDELQSIYSFRHAEVALFRERGERLARQEAALALTRNFRSRPAILAAVERIFAARMGKRFAPLLATRASSPRAPMDGQALAGGGEPGEGPTVELLLTDKRGWERLPQDPRMAALPDAPAWRQAEARLLAARVAELIATGAAAPADVVVLLRALGDLPVYESALRARGLATVAATGGFWSHQQVGDLLAWLRALANPLDELALYSTLASPLVGVSSDGLALIAGFAGDSAGGVWQSMRERAPELDELLCLADRERVASFRELFAAQRAGAPLQPIASLLARATAASGYEAHVLSLDGGERRLAFIHKLIALARSFEAQEGRDLRGFLDHVAHVDSALGGREADATAGEELRAVRLMSIHAAKGLEFPVVCVADLGREPNLRQPDLLVDRADGRIGLRLLSLDSGQACSALAYDELCDERKAAQEEEEDRILYVACTRARERLIVSGSAPFERWPTIRAGVAPIAWLAPALVPDVPSLVASDAALDRALTVAVEPRLHVRCLLNAPRDPPAVPPSSEPGTDTSTPGISTSPPASQAPRSGSAHTSATGGTGAGGHAPTAPLADRDETISYTSLAELERCGYRYYLERVLRIPERRAATRGGDEQGLDARLRGTIVHALLEAVDFSDPRAPSDRDVARVASRLGASVAERERREIVDLLSAALASEPAQRLRGARAVRREYPFAFSLGPDEPLVTGFLDLIVEREDGGRLIVDYKSDRLSGGEDLEELVRRDYGFQRLLYALAAIEAGARQVEVAHWFLERPASWVSAPFAHDQRDELRSRLLGDLAAARARGFAVTKDPHRELCLSCPGRGGLCSWGETHTMRARSTTLASAG